MNTYLRYSVEIPLTNVTFTDAWNNMRFDIIQQIGVIKAFFKIPASKYELVGVEGYLDIYNGLSAYATSVQLLEGSVVNSINGAELNSPTPDVGGPVDPYQNEIMHFKPNTPVTAPMLLGEGLQLTRLMFDYPRFASSGSAPTAPLKVTGIITFVLRDTRMF